MNRIADLIKNSTMQNPFADSQARNFSDTKIINEFYPISNYWSLFNDQHEILLGTRGSGKTFLLKMMRYSMLKRIDTPLARQMASEKKYIALYIPMYLEFVTHLTRVNVTEEKQVELFQFAFNCLLAQSLLVELNEIISEQTDFLIRAKLNMKLAFDINQFWFNDDGSDISDLFSLSTKLKKLFYSIDINVIDIHNIPPVFRRTLGATLLAVKELLSAHLGLKEEPTWIICIDEAEFLSEPMQRCINSVFRSDSGRIALKVATLPFYHTTLKTLNPDISVSSGNDFSYRVVDIPYENPDFINLTNTLVSHRIKSRLNLDQPISSLEDFLGKLGNDDQIDYYREELGNEESDYQRILEEIINEFSDTRKKNSKNYPNQRKTIYDKFAPIFYVRKMFRLSKEGNRVPGWYAGSQMIRKISQGNPRAFIQIMNDLFERARKSELTPKAQHKVVLSYAHKFCESTQALESNGPVMYRELKLIAQSLHEHVHNQSLVSAGCNFKIIFDNDESFEHTKKWLQQAVAYSKIMVDENTLKNGIAMSTQFALSNTYAAEYWLPMREDISPQKISIKKSQKETYTVKIPTSTKPEVRQISFFDEDPE